MRRAFLASPAKFVRAATRLNFPNPTRIFDAARNGVSFVGHDGVFDIRFLVDAGALDDGTGPQLSEANCLAAFDRLLDSIHDVAREAYSSNPLASHGLSAADFR